MAMAVLVPTSGFNGSGWVALFGNAFFFATWRDGGPRKTKQIYDVVDRIVNIP